MEGRSGEGSEGGGRGEGEGSWDGWDLFVIQVNLNYVIQDIWSLNYTFMAWVCIAKGRYGERVYFMYIFDPCHKCY